MSAATCFRCSAAVSRRLRTIRSPRIDSEILARADVVGGVALEVAAGVRAHPSGFRLCAARHVGTPATCGLPVARPLGRATPLAALPIRPLEICQRDHAANWYFLLFIDDSATNRDANHAVPIDEVRSSTHGGLGMRCTGSHDIIIARILPDTPAVSLRSALSQNDLQPASFRVCTFAPTAVWSRRGMGAIDDVRAIADRPTASTPSRCRPPECTCVRQHTRASNRPS